MLKNLVYKILRKTEKYTQTDMVYLATGGFWLTSGQIISTVSGFLLAIAFANLLPKETYGIYKYILSIVGLLTIFTLPGINTALSQAVARGYEGSVYKSIKIKISCGLLASLASLSLAGYYYLNGNNTLTFSFLITSLFIPFLDTLSIYNNFLQNKKLFAIASKFDMLSKIIATVIIMLAVFFSKNIFIILTTYLVAHTLLHLIFLRITLHKYPPNTQEDTATMAYGKHLSLMGIIEIIAAQIDKILIFQYLGATELAIYYMALAPSDQIKGLLKNIRNLSFPKFAEKSINDIRKTIFKKIIKLNLIISLVIILYIIFIPYVYKIFLPQYLESIFYSQLIVITLLFISSSLIVISILEAHGRTKKLYKIKIISAITQIIFTISGLYFYGLIGLIIANIIYQFLYMLLLMINLRNYFLTADTK